MIGSCTNCLQGPALSGVVVAIGYSHENGSSKKEVLGTVVLGIVSGLIMSYF